MKILGDPSLAAPNITGEMVSLKTNIRTYHLSFSNDPNYGEAIHILTFTSWWFQPISKILVKLDHLPRDRDENKKYLSCHHLVYITPTHHPCFHKSLIFFQPATLDLDPKDPQNPRCASRIGSPFLQSH